ncbi:hypothetical protein [uncultured Microbulbifer sp.]|uniref:hypothetical protein n=1 Tax=uncultured Microbulbifer sp. TaxID=348147 RepID=UPI0025EFC53F|nr:hypothetical protein [uncultured Microbulbifer sp.]
MGVKVKVDGLMVLTAAAIGGGLFLYAKRGAIGQALNPTSDQNIAYKGVNAVGSTVTGEDDFSLGVWLYEKTHPEQMAAEKELFQPTPVDDIQPYTGSNYSGWGAM